MEINNKQGFTLLEILVAMGVASVVGILVTQVFFTTTRSNTKTELLKDVKQSGEFSLGIIERMIRNAENVVSTCSSAGTQLGDLTIQNQDGNTTTFRCVLDNGITRIASQSGSGAIEYLTSKNVTIGGTGCADTLNTLDFVCTSFSGGQKRIAISFTLIKAGVSVDQLDQASATFTTQVTMRN